jgi:formate-dependent nitrite reductase cytochrome c552 subunit
VIDTKVRFGFKAKTAAEAKAEALAELDNVLGEWAPADWRVNIDMAGFRLDVATPDDPTAQIIPHYDVYVIAERVS